MLQKRSEQIKVASDVVQWWPSANTVVVLRLHKMRKNLSPICATISLSRTLFMFSSHVAERLCGSGSSKRPER